MGHAQLKQEIEKLKKEGIDPVPLRVERHRRMAMAFSPLVFILTGLPLGITTRRAQRSIGFGLSVLIFLGYYLFMVMGQALAQKGMMAVGPALWLGNGVFFALGTLLIWRTART